MGGHTTCEKYLVSKGASVQEIPSHISNKLKIDRPFKVPKIFRITKSDINTTTTSSKSPVAINDSSFGVIDRLGYKYYALAIAKVLKGAASPICVGIYSRWGTGKSSLMEMIKKALDPTVEEENFKIIQSFETEVVEPIFHERSKIIWTRFAEVCVCIPAWLERNLYPYLDTVVSWTALSFYGFFAIKVIIMLMKDFPVFSRIAEKLFLFLEVPLAEIPTVPLNHSKLYAPSLLVYSFSIESLISYFRERLIKSLLLHFKLSSSDVYIFIGLLLYWFVKFSRVFKIVFAVSFFASLTLVLLVCVCAGTWWLGLTVVYISLCWCCAVYWSNTTLVILEIFQRFFDSDDQSSSQRDKAAAPSKGLRKEYLFVDFNAWEFSASEELWTGLIRNLYEKVELRLSNLKIEATGLNWKEKWRIKKSIELLEKKYGGKFMLQLWCILLFLVGVFVVLLALGVTLTAIENKESNYDDILAIFATAIPGCAWLKVFVDAIAAMNKVSDTSRGEFLFEESKSIRDRTGFMSDVREELSDLFKFINEDFRRETGIQLLLVLFIDDLDRVLEGRNVKMLEAVQLLLNVPGAPVFVFLAIDSRIVVASIEQQLNKQSNLKGVRITGWEYLEKFVQIPLSIPEVSPERIQYLLEKSLRVTINEEQLKSFLMKVVGHINKLITDNGCKNLQCRFDSGGTSFDVSALSLVSEWDKKNRSLLGSFIAIANVLKLRRSVDRNDKEQLEALYSDLHTTISNAKYVEVPVQPKQINPQPTRTTTVAPQSVNKVETPIPTQRTEPVIPEAPISEKFFDAPLITDETSELLPANMADMMKQISRRVDCNPRGIKRLINLLQIIAEIGKIKPITGIVPPVTIKDWKGGETWKSFSQKAVIWIFMAQSFSFRLSALVQILLDFEQKADFNVEDASAEGYKYKMWTICEKDSKTIVPKNAEKEEKFDDMTIFHFYHTYVEKFIYAMPCSEKLLRVDKDPEDFAFLLKFSASFELKCQDILGPKIDLKTDGNSERVRDFSLLAYSFNLDPAMRLEIGEDIAGLVSEHEMFNEGNEPVALRHRSIVRKKDYINCKYN
eukprot:gene34825-45052_t